MVLKDDNPPPPYHLISKEDNQNNNNNDSNNDDDIEDTSEPVSQPKLEDFRSFKYSIESIFPKFDKTKVQDPKFIPTTTEALAHLKLLKAFAVMKSKVVRDADAPKDFQINQWKSFITMAVRRFIIFVSALKTLYIGNNGKTTHRSFEELNKKEEFENVMAHLLPPLDVIMVWHAFLLNPKAFYDTFSRNSFIDFAKYPLPLDRIDFYINNETFEYKVSETYQTNYIDLLKRFTNNGSDLIYHMNNFIMYEQYVIINCPTCKIAISDPIPLVTDENKGFADSEFMAKKKYQQKSIDSTDCYCSHIEYLTHDQLRKLQLFHDIHASEPLPGINKHFSNFLSHPRFSNRNTSIINYTIKDEAKKFWDNSSISVSTVMVSVISATTKSSDIKKAILRDYLQFNLIHLTVPNNTISIGEDLVGCVLRQESFVKKMNTINWVHSTTAQEKLETSLVRYQRFFRMLTDKNLKRMLVPTLDIDLMWHTHQLWMYGYFHDCLNSPCHSAIDHNDKIEEAKLDNGFEYTSKAYKKKFKEDYSICYCQYCSELRVTKREKIKSFFKSSRSDDKKLYSTFKSASSENLLVLESPSHISTHNSIQLPTHTAETHRLKKPVPWSTANSNFQFYVVSPIAPVAEAHSQFYGNGLCCSVTASCASGATCCQIASGGCGSSGGGCSSGGCGATAFGGGGCGGGGGGGCGGGGCGGGGGGN